MTREKELMDGNDRLTRKKEDMDTLFLSRVSFSLCDLEEEKITRKEDLMDGERWLDKKKDR